MRYGSGDAGYAVLVATLICVPLALDLYGLQPFWPVKNALLLAGVALAAGLLVLERWLDRSARFRLRDLDHRQVGCAVLFWIWVVPAGLPTAVNRALHVDGSVWLTAQMAPMFLLAAAIAPIRDGDRGDRRRRVMGCLAISGLIMVLHGYLQAVGLDPLSLMGSEPAALGRWRVFTTTGNPNWTAEYVASTAPLVVFFARRLGRRWHPGTRSPTGGWWNFARAAAAGYGPELLTWTACGAVVLQTGSRLGVLALVAGALSASLLGGRERGRAERTGRAATIRWCFTLSALAILALIVLAGSLVLPPGYDVGERWREMPPVWGRLVLYASSVHIVTASPWVGHGLGHFRLLLPLGMERVVPVLSSEPEPWLPRDLVPHVHNDWLDLAVASGLIGVLIFLVLALLTWRGVARGVRRGPEPELEAALGGSLVAIGVLTLGSFPLQSPSTAVLFWSLLGLVATRVPGGERQCIARNPGGPDGRASGSDAGGGVAALPSDGRRWIRGLVTVVAILLLILSMRHAGNRLVANRMAFEAESLVRQGNYGAAEERYRRVVSRNPNDHEGWVALAGLLARRGQYAEALSTLDAAERVAASREAWLLRSELLYRTGDAMGAIGLLERAVRITPDFLRAQLALGDLLWYEGEIERAARAYGRILASGQDSARARTIKERAAERLEGLPSY